MRHIQIHVFIGADMVVEIFEEIFWLFYMFNN